MYKNYVRSTDIVRVISGCFCSYSSMKLLYSVVCISILNVQFSYHYPYDPNLAHASKCHYKCIYNEIKLHVGVSGL